MVSKILHSGCAVRGVGLASRTLVAAGAPKRCGFSPGVLHDGKYNYCPMKWYEMVPVATKKIKCTRVLEGISDSCSGFSTLDPVGRELYFGCWNTGLGRDTRYLQIEFRQTNIHKQDCVCIRSI